GYYSALRGADRRVVQETEAAIRRKEDEEKRKAAGGLRFAIIEVSRGRLPGNIDENVVFTDIGKLLYIFVRLAPYLL
ncbi:MAG: hypothetical protein MUQ00_16470, partial [Candidatus Aminicenantes bacterium]|nr:hypothetical protein [Candidatus Aminicenantes bacterium]